MNKKEFLQTIEQYNIKSICVFACGQPFLDVNKFNYHYWSPIVCRPIEEVEINEYSFCCYPKTIDTENGPFKLIQSYNYDDYGKTWTFDFENIIYGEIKYDNTGQSE